MPTGLSPSMEDLSRSLRLNRPFVTSYSPCKANQCSHDPDITTFADLHNIGLDCFRFARRYSGSRGFFLFLGLLRCFSSPRSPRTPMYSVHVSMSSTWRVSPFGNPRIIACLAAPRGLSQPRNVLRRFLAPEHPPCTLISLTTITPSLCNSPTRDLTRTARFMIAAISQGDHDEQRPRQLELVNEPRRSVGRSMWRTMS